jgi:hypothetical protein
MFSVRQINGGESLHFFYVNFWRKENRVCSEKQVFTSDRNALRRRNSFRGAGTGRDLNID